MRFLTEADKTYLSNLYYEMGCLYQDFVRVAKLYTELIVNELHLPAPEKTVKPADIGGIAGGEKVRHQN